jgi:AraC-like DNA-binding protein
MMPLRETIYAACDDLAEEMAWAGGADSQIRELKPLKSPALRLASRHALIGASLEKLLPSAAEKTGTEVDRVALVILRGSAQLQVGDQRFTLAAGEVAFLPPGTAYAETAAGNRPADRIALIFATEEIALNEPAVVRDSAGRLRELANWLVSERRSSFPGAESYRDRLLDLFLSEVARLQDDSCTALERQTRSYVIEHLADPITLQDLASNVGMSRHYFCRLYHKVSGESPMTTVRNLRLERARELALTTKLPLRVIAERVGLNSQYHLSRMLRTHFGVGVKELRTGGLAEETDAVQATA